jgi:hypothetical protein
MAPIAVLGGDRAERADIIGLVIFRCQTASFDKLRCCSKVAAGPNGASRRAARSLAAAVMMVASWALPGDARAASFAAKDLQVLGRALAFMQPPPSDQLIAIVYVAGNADSRRDAEAIAAAIGEGLPIGPVLLRPKLIDLAAVGSGGFQVAIAAAGANGPRLSAAARAAHALCVTTDVEAVRAGLCAMAITSEPRVEILVNHTVSEAAGIAFATAFRMMIKEM